MLQVMLPAANIGTAVRVCKDTIATPHIVNKSTFIAASIRISRYAGSLPLVLLPVALVPHIRVRPSIFAVSVFLIHDPLTFVAVGAITCDNGHFTFTVTLVIGPTTRVNRLITVGHRAIPVFLALGPFAVVFVPC